MLDQLFSHNYKISHAETGLEQYTQTNEGLALGKKQDSKTARKFKAERDCIPEAPSQPSLVYSVP